MGKVITSRSEIDNLDDAINGRKRGEETMNERVLKTLMDLIKSDEFKKAVEEQINQNDSYDEATKNKLKAELSKRNLFEKKLVTEYHLMGIYKAASQ